ncbi:MAG: hypothetical protein LLF92_05670 [Planctomycetaceae bacterium]|nr:hypothetical protein [Planctomycetaceae bacterium]
MKRIRFYQLAIILSVLASVTAFAAESKRPAAMGAPVEETTAAPVSAEANASAAELKYPYVGEVTAADLNIRSGPGMNFYSCGKIGQPARIVVLGEQFTWSQIMPPPGSFSWIFKQYVQVDVNKPEIGVVNSDNVRVYAGADDRDAMVSDSVQVTLNKDQKVRLLGQPVGDYYKITPPEGATLWLNTQYIKFLRKADEIDMKTTKPAAKTAAATKEAKPAGFSTPNVVVDQVDPNNKYLEQYYSYTKQLEDEKVKPLADQNYVAIRAGLESLAADKDAGKAAEYAQYTLKTVSRYELAKQSASLIDGQKSALQKQLEEIENERQKKKAETGIGTRFDMTGMFKPSAVYSRRPDLKRYIVMDDKDKPVSYAEPATAAVQGDLKEYYGKKVGLNGEISTDPLSNFPLIKFTEIQVLSEDQTEEQPENKPADQSAAVDAELKDSNTPSEPNMPSEPNTPSEEPTNPAETNDANP